MWYAGKDIEKQCSGIYPLQSVFVRKVKILRAPRFDVTKLMEVHGDYTEEVCTYLSNQFYVCMTWQSVNVSHLCMVLCLCCVWPSLHGSSVSLALQQFVNVMFCMCLTAVQPCTLSQEYNRQVTLVALHNLCPLDCC